ESVELWLLAGRYRQSARAKRECATVPRHRGRGCPRCANLVLGLMRGVKIRRAYLLSFQLAGRDRSHHRCGYVMVCHSASAPFSMNPTTEPRTATLTINEIYHSIQGESTWAGLPCVFVRLTFCDLRCTYCDTAYAFYEGEKKTLSEVTTEVLKFDCSLVEITGGEPLLQKNVLPLMSALADAGKTVLLETSGAHDIAKVDRRAHRNRGLKTTGRGEWESNLVANHKHLTPRVRVK